MTPEEACELMGGIVGYWANKYKSIHGFDDLYQTGMLAVLESIQKFDDTTFTCSFKTYAGNRAQLAIVDAVRGTYRSDNSEITKHRKKLVSFDAHLENFLGEGANEYRHGPGKRKADEACLHPCTAEENRYVEEVKKFIKGLPENLQHFANGHFFQDKRNTDLMEEMQLSEGRISQLKKEVTERLEVWHNASVRRG